MKLINRVVWLANQFGHPPKQPTLSWSFRLTLRGRGLGIHWHTGLGRNGWRPYTWLIGQLDLPARRHLYLQHHPGSAWHLSWVVFHNRAPGGPYSRWELHRLRWVQTH